MGVIELQGELASAGLSGVVIIGVVSKSVTGLVVTPGNWILLV